MGTEVNTISPKAFTHIFGEAERCNRRYCFILGSGASRQAGIMTGVDMAGQWARQIKEKYEDKEREDLMRKLGIDSIEVSSKNYFGIYDLRFYPDYQEGYAYFERELEKGIPSLGHHVLAKILAGKTHNLAITTNFDSLVEDALFIYTKQHPLIVGHESLAQFINLNIDRPIVAKIHRSLYYHPFNRQQETNDLAKEWQNTLKTAFMVYTPVVIGYAGGDQSLMKFLSDESVKMNGMYWCYWDKEEPSGEIIDLVKSKNGCLVPIESFDQIMFLISRKLGIENPEKEMNEVTKSRIERYNLQYDEFEKRIREESEDASNSIIVETVTQMDSWNDRLLKEIGEEETFDAYFQKGRIYARMAEYQSAVDAYTKAIELNPESCDAYNNRGSGYRHLGEYKKAIEDYEKAIELNPKFTMAYNNRGIVYSSMGEYKKAIENYEKAIELNPEYSKAYNNRGNSYNNMGEYKKAIENYEKAIELNPEYGLAYYNRGIAHQKMREYEKCIEDCTKCIDFDPNYIDAYELRADSYEALNRMEEAEEDRKKARMLSED